MMTGTQKINRFFLIATAPFLGMLFWLLFLPLDIQLPDPEPQPENVSLPETAPLAATLDKAAQDAAYIRASIRKVYSLYNQSANAMTAMLRTAAAAAARPGILFDSRISARLGAPIGQVNSDNISLKLYSFQEDAYHGYALKVDMKTDKAMKMVLGEDKIGGSETTLNAASRYGAVAGVNAGGFADAGGKRYPLSTTILNGKYVYGFEPSFDNLCFIGISADRKLIGGRFYKQSELDKLKPSFGATFVPILLQGGQKQDIPDPWLTSPRRAPRTVVANFRNDQLLFIVTDGYNENGNSGATLPELQDKLISLGAVDAYNLDGGGSSSLVFNGRVINHPSDNGRLRPLATHFLFFK
jgi:exopolysaccharide biosynthesis protein